MVFMAKPSTWIDAFLYLEKAILVVKYFTAKSDIGLLTKVFTGIFYKIEVY